MYSTKHKKHTHNKTHKPNTIRHHASANGGACFPWSLKIARALTGKACANRYCNRSILKQFKRNVFRLQTIKRFACGDDAAFCQITLTTCSVSNFSRTFQRKADAKLSTYASSFVTCIANSQNCLSSRLTHYCYLQLRKTKGVLNC